MSRNAEGPISAIYFDTNALLEGHWPHSSGRLQEIFDTAAAGQPHRTIAGAGLLEKCSALIGIALSRFVIEPLNLL